MSSIHKLGGLNFVISSMLKKNLLLVVLFMSNCSYAQSKTDSLMLLILDCSRTPVSKQVLKDPKSFRVQIIYTQINRNKQNKPSFKNYYYHYDAAAYFNPASMVKMPLAFLSLEKLNHLKNLGIDKFSSMAYDSSYQGQKIMLKDSVSENGLPSIATFIKRAFLISENDPYNRMYQFMGQEAINKILVDKGYNHLRITRQFMGFSEDQNRHTNPIRFINKEGALIYDQPGAYNQIPFDFNMEFKVGNGYRNKKDSIINEPFDFTKHNYVPLEYFQQLLQSILFPSSVPLKKGFGISKQDRNFLLQYLSQYPSETNYPKYDTSLFYDSYAKFFFQDSTHRMPNNIRVFNKVGWAYGFLTDVSYVLDIKNNIEFMLSATIYTNKNEILNDDKYEYETVGHPFLKDIGQTFYQYELTRSRNFHPKLSNFGILYEKRNERDKRLSIKEVDN